MFETVPRLSVVVCTYNRCGLLERALKSLTDQTLDRRLFEILVIDNNSTDETAMRVKTYIDRCENLKYFVEIGQGLSHARNRGWREAQGRYVAYMDDDAEATPSWCERILSSFETVSPTPDAVGGTIFPRYDCTPPKWFSDQWETRSWGDGACFLEKSQRRFGFSGSNMAFRKQVLVDYKGFSPRYGMTGTQFRLGEEAELFFRMSRDNRKLFYDPDIAVRHLVPRAHMNGAYYFKRAFFGTVTASAIRGRQPLALDGLRIGKHLFAMFLSTFKCVTTERDGVRRAGVENARLWGSLLGVAYARLLRDDLPHRRP